MRKLDVRNYNDGLIITLYVHQGCRYTEPRHRKTIMFMTNCMWNYSITILFCTVKGQCANLFVNSWRLCGGWSMLLIARPNSPHRRSMGLVHFSDVLLPQIINHYSGTIRRSIVILVAKIISNVLPSKWYQGVPQDVTIHDIINVPIQGHKHRVNKMT